MTAPPSYPRIPFLWPSGNDHDDLVVDGTSRSGWLTDPVVVEEKLDGANVSLWLEGNVVHVSSRGGAGAMDRAGQLGRLRAWAAEHDETLRPLLGTGLVVYGEWLWLTHGVRYDALPDLLIVLDMWHPATGFTPTSQRDRHAQEAGLWVPPVLFAGVLGTADRLAALLGSSRWSSSFVEGAVLRRGPGDRVKVVRSGYRRRTDAEWSRSRTFNNLERPAQPPASEPGRRPVIGGQPVATAAVW